MNGLEYISLENATRAFDECINEAATGSVARALIQAKEAVLSHTETMYNVQFKKHGKWLEITSDWEDDYFKCSECGEEWYLEVGTPIENGMKYCPNCDADLRQDGDST